MAILNQNPRLYKTGIALDLLVVGSDELSLNENFKTIVHKAIGNKDYYEFVGKGDQKLSFKTYIEDKNAYNDLLNFFEDGKPFLLELQDIKAPFRLDGPIKSTKSYKDDSYIAELNFTSAQEPDFENDIDISGLGGIAETAANKKTALDKLRDWGKNTIDFVSNANGAVAAYTGKFQDYAVAINQLTAGIASSSSIITTPLSSVKNSVSSIIGGVSGVVSSIGTAINAIKQIPSDIDAMIDSILAIGDLFSNIFALDNKQEQLKTTCNFLVSVGDSLTNVAESPLTTRIISDDSFTYSVTYDPEITLTSENDKNIEVLSVLILSSILLAIYDQSIQVTRWNKRDLDIILKKTEALFRFITSKEISGEIRTALVASRNAFFRSYQPLYSSAAKIVILKLDEPRFLADVIYSVNGNFNYYQETRKLNNIIGSVVQGTIEVISND